jgi:hypothetical protein
LLVYYKRAELLRINQWLVGTHTYDAQAEHSIALGRMHAVHVSTFLNIQKKTYNCAGRTVTVLQLMEIGLRRMRRKRACWHDLCSLERSTSCHVIIAI